MEDILYSAKEANQFKDTSKKVYFVNCPVCEKKGFRLTHYMYCSKECEFEVIAARKWIEDNKYAKNGDYVEINGVKGLVRATTMNDILIAKKPDLNIHNYWIELDGEEIGLRDVTSFLKRC